MKILVMPYFLAIKWVFFRQILIILNLIILIQRDDPETITHVRLLAWHIKSETSKALKKGNVCSMVFVKMVGFLHARRWEKRNRTNFYRAILLMCINNIEVLKHFATKNYAWKLDIISGFHAYFFVAKCFTTSILLMHIKRCAFLLCKK